MDELNGLGNNFFFCWQNFEPDYECKYVIDGKCEAKGTYGLRLL
jgi:hypothetical protein